MKEGKYTCAKCGAKQSKAKGKEVSVECHHEDGIDWQGVVDLVRERILSGKMAIFCKDCHDKEHGKK